MAIIEKKNDLLLIKAHNNDPKIQLYYFQALFAHTVSKSIHHFPFFPKIPFPFSSSHRKPKTVWLRRYLTYTISLISSCLDHRCTLEHLCKISIFLLHCFKGNFWYQSKHQTKQ